MCGAFDQPAVKGRPEHNAGDSSCPCGTERRHGPLQATSATLCRPDGAHIVWGARFPRLTPLAIPARAGTPMGLGRAILAPAYGRSTGPRRARQPEETGDRNGWSAGRTLLSMPGQVLDEHGLVDPRDGLQVDHFTISSILVRAYRPAKPCPRPHRRESFVASYYKRAISSRHAQNSTKPLAQAPSPSLRRGACPGAAGSLGLRAQPALRFWVFAFLRFCVSSTRPGPAAERSPGCGCGGRVPGGGPPAPDGCPRGRRGR